MRSDEAVGKVPVEVDDSSPRYAENKIRGTM